MEITSPLAEARAWIQKSLDVAKKRQEEARGDSANVIGGKVLGFEEALRIIDQAVEQ